mgnify:FL=1
MKKFLSILFSVILMICLAVPAMGAAYKGDVNNDEAVNSADALIILQYSAGIIEDININRADINGDGKVNSADALQVLQTAVGLLKPIKYCDCAE